MQDNTLKECYEAYGAKSIYLTLPYVPLTAKKVLELIIFLKNNDKIKHLSLCSNHIWCEINGKDLVINDFDLLTSLYDLLTKLKPEFNSDEVQQIKEILKR